MQDSSANPYLTLLHILFWGIKLKQINDGDRYITVQIIYTLNDGHFLQVPAGLELSLLMHILTGMLACGLFQA